MQHTHTLLLTKAKNDYLAFDSGFADAKCFEHNGMSYVHVRTDGTLVATQLSAGDRVMQRVERPDFAEEASDAGTWFALESSRLPAGEDMKLTLQTRQKAISTSAVKGSGKLYR